jgi:hypothetical protein
MLGSCYHLVIVIRNSWAQSDPIKQPTAYVLSNKNQSEYNFKIGNFTACLNYTIVAISIEKLAN